MSLIQHQLSTTDLIDTLLSIHSTTLTSTHILSAISQLQQYLQRFRNRLKPIHALWVRQTLSVLQGLGKVAEGVISQAGVMEKAKAEMMDANTLMAKVGGGSDQVNLVELVTYLKESKLARKVSGFAEKAEEAAAMQGGFDARDID